MKTISKAVRASEETFKILKVLAAEEGRTMGKMLEILVQEYRKQQAKKKDS